METPGPELHRRRARPGAAGRRDGARRATPARRARSARPSNASNAADAERRAGHAPRDHYRAAAEGHAARHRLPEAPRPDRRDRRALRPGLCARRLAQPGQRVPALRRSAARRSGLVIAQAATTRRRTPSKRYDRFRDRIMFPIRSVQGEVIGFGGRVLDDGEPKYLNSPETPVFSKGRELYGLFEARTALRERGYALVVEGYMDVVALAQIGLRQCGGDARHRLHRRARAKAVSLHRLRWSSASTATPPGGAPRAARSRPPAARQRHAHHPLPVPAARARPRLVTCASTAPRRSSSRWPQAVPLSRQLLEAASEGCDLGSRRRPRAPAGPGQAAVVGAARRRAARASCWPSWRAGRHLERADLPALWGAGAHAARRAKPAPARSPSPRRAGRWPAAPPRCSTARCGCCCSAASCGSGIGAEDHEPAGGAAGAVRQLLRAGSTAACTTTARSAAAACSTGCAGLGGGCRTGALLAARQPRCTTSMTASTRWPTCDTVLLRLQLEQVERRAQPARRVAEQLAGDALARFNELGKRRSELNARIGGRRSAARAATCQAGFDAEPGVRR